MTPGTRRCRSAPSASRARSSTRTTRSEEHTSELQSQSNLVCRLLLEKKNVHCSMFNSIVISHLSKYSRMPQRVPSRLRINAQPMRALSNRNLRDKMTVIGIDRIDLRIVAAGKPQHFAIGRDPTHVRAAATGQLPFLHDALGFEIDE